MDDMEEMLERAAQKGAREVLKQLGLDDDHAARDLAEIRSMLSIFRDMRREALLTFSRWATVFILGLLVLVVWSKANVSILTGWLLPKP